MMELLSVFLWFILASLRRMCTCFCLPEHTKNLGAGNCDFALCPKALSWLFSGLHYKRLFLMFPRWVLCFCGIFLVCLSLKCIDTSPGTDLGFSRKGCSTPPLPMVDDDGRLELLGQLGMLVGRAGSRWRKLLFPPPPTLSTLSLADLSTPGSHLSYLIGPDGQRAGCSEQLYRVLGLTRDSSGDGWVPLSCTCLPPAPVSSSGWD